MSSHTMRTAAMPMGMVVGALLCRQISAFDTWTGNMLTPVLIFAMLFFTYCRVDIRRMRLSMLHVWLLAVQIIGSVAVYYALLPLGAVTAEGGMVCVLAPIAMAAVVIGGMLGANIETMATYSLLCNLVTALVAPAILSLTGSGDCSFGQIIMRIAPLLILPFAAGQAVRFGVRPVGRWVAAHSSVSFYLWLVSLAVIMGRTTAFVLDRGEAESGQELVLAAVALVLCLLQFAVGRRIGVRYGDKVAGGQSLGQKNTILAVWMSQSFLSPLSCVAPTAYIVWQNVVNSYQIYKSKQ